MNDQRAQELRGAFNRLDDEHRLTVTETDFIPAMLGRAIAFTYTITDGVLTSASAYNTPIVTVGDLRRLEAQHPRTEETDSTDPAQRLGEGIVQGLAPLISSLRTEILWSRLRFRALLELLVKQNPALYPEFESQLREVAARDGIAFDFSIRLAGKPEVFKREFSTWQQVEDDNRKSRLGESAEEHAQDWYSLLSKLQDDEAEILSRLNNGDEAEEP